MVEILGPQEYSTEYSIGILYRVSSTGLPVVAVVASVDPIRLPVQGTVADICLYKKIYIYV